MVIVNRDTTGLLYHAVEKLRRRSKRTFSPFFPLAPRGANSPNLLTYMKKGGTVGGRKEKKKVCRCDTGQREEVDEQKSEGGREGRRE